MLDILLDGLLDTLKLLPYLLITFLVLELIEHKLDNKKIITKNSKLGPIFGGLLGALPQCGFSSMAANLFSARVITMGTLIAVFLSTSDEMLPIMIGEKVEVLFLAKILLFKTIVGIIIGYIIDLIFIKRNELKNNNIKEICEHEHCSCESDGILKSSIIHTLKIGIFILITNLLIGFIIEYIG